MESLNNTICPRCKKTNTIKFGTRKLTLANGRKKAFQMFKCKDCGHQFSDNTLDKGTIQPYIPTPKQNAILIKRATKLEITRDEYINKVLFEPHKH